MEYNFKKVHTGEDLCKCCGATIAEYLRGKDVTPQVKKGSEGGSVRLDVYYRA